MTSPSTASGEDEGTHRGSCTQRLQLLGTLHCDPEGYRKLSRFLHDHRPDLILVELSPYGLLYRKRHGAALLRTLRENLTWAASHAGVPASQANRHSEIVAIRRQLAIPFEYRASMKFASRCGSTLKLVDASPFSRKMIESWQDLISRENLLQLLSLPPRRPDMERSYTQALQLIRGESPEHFSAARFVGRMQEARFWEERERGLAQAVIRELRTHRPLRPLYVGGWQHLAPGAGFPSLRDLLGIPGSSCRVLSPRTLPPLAPS